MNCRATHALSLCAVAVRTPSRAERHSAAVRKCPAESKSARVAGLLWLISLLSLAQTQVAAQMLTQTFTLQPGWNAIYLEVDPSDRTPSAVFTNLPILSVWTWKTRLSATDFIQNPSEPAFNRDEWLVYFPESKPEAQFNNLFAVVPRRAYLVRLDGPSAITLKVTGKVSLRHPSWAPDAYNLRGFPVDTVSPPSFQTFFRVSPAHYDSRTRQLQPIYRLTAGGVWVQVQPHETMRRGEAYWVYTRGASEFIAPLTLSAASFEGLVFDASVSELTLNIRNDASEPLRIAFSNTQANDPPLQISNPLASDPNLRLLPMQAQFELSASAGSGVSVTLAANRGSMVSSFYETLYEVRDRLGTLHYLPIRVTKDARPVGKQSLHSLAAAPVSVYAGLWVGHATIQAVTEAHSSNPVMPTPVAMNAGFDLRLLVHVDNTGQARLLKDVTLMRPPTNNAAGSASEGIVLVTDPKLFSQFQGVALRDGTPVGRRIASAHFDFAETDLKFLGAFGGTNILSLTNALGADFPTNPFRHKFHPDHKSGYAITRFISLQFSTNAPPGSVDYGFSLIAGTYSEIIRGLHKRDLVVSGPFTLRRTISVGNLNGTSSTAGAAAASN